MKRHMWRKYSLPTLVIFMSLSLAPFAAQAQTREVFVRQIYPYPSTQQVTCTEAGKQCFAAMRLSGTNDPVEGEYLDMAFGFSQDAAYAQFMRDREYLAVDEGGSTSLTIPLRDDGKAISDVVLYRALPDNDDMNRLSVTHWEKSIALQILVQNQKE